MKINVIYNKYIPDYKNTLEIIELALIRKKIEFKSFELDNMEDFGDFTFVIGGDGTLLRAARFYAKFKIPVIGINAGRLGFLSQSGIKELDLLTEAVINKDYTVEERLMLFSDKHTALNDFVIKGCDSSRTSKFYLEINGNAVCNYIADGIIISTPTGSTAYCLSAGGPVLHPELNAIVIVPICPHTLNARPLVIPAGETISVVSTERPLSVSVDGYEREECYNKITVKSASYKAYLAFLKNNSFYSVLRDKLHWGISPEE